MTDHPRVVGATAAVPVGGRRPLALSDDRRCALGLCRELGEHPREGVEGLVCATHAAVPYWSAGHVLELAGHHVTAPPRPGRARGRRGAR